MVRAKVNEDNALKPICDIEAERNVIGALLCPGGEDVIYDLAALIQSDAFYLRAHQHIYNACLALADGQHPVDIVTVREILSRRGQLEAVGGTAKLIDLAEGAHTSANALYHAHIVRDKNLLRIAQRTMAEISQDILHSRQPASEILEEAEKKFFGLMERRVESGDATPIQGALRPALAEIERAKHLGGAPSGLASGLIDLDRLTRGFKPGELIIIAGRPSMGKSTFGVNLLRRVCVLDGMPAAFFSLEMPVMQLTTHLLCAQASVSAHKVQRGLADTDDDRLLLEACGELDRAPIWIDDTSGQSILDIRAKARRYLRQHHLKLIIVDYLQKITTHSRHDKRHDSRQQEVAYICRTLKDIARELNIPVVVMAQLSRRPEQRENKRPQLADLRETGEIEQEADIVLFLYREEYYHPDKEATKGIAEIIVAKNRSGPTGKVLSTFVADKLRFENYAQRREF